MVLSENDLLSVQELKTYFYTSYGVVKAVDGVSLKVQKQEAIGVVGESGSGKSVTALSIMKLVPSPPGKIIHGEILYKGEDILPYSERDMISIRGKEISMVFQDPLTYINPVLRIDDQIAEAIRIHQGKTKKEAQDEVVDVLKRVNIPSPREVAKSYPHQLSGGMRQRVLIAIAISCNPSLLIADEPTTALDVTIQAQILELIKELRQELDTSLMLITHDLGIVAEVCDRVYVMYAGQIVEQADIFLLFEDPKHPYTTGLLKSALSIDEFRKELFILEGNVPSLIDPPSGCRFHPRCPHAMPICKQETAILTPEGNSGRTVACWLYNEEKK
jgi:oligopeptide/dipeptide ABC transporter ATP-binding protein